MCKLTHVAHHMLHLYLSFISLIELLARVTGLQNNKRAVIIRKFMSWPDAPLFYWLLSRLVVYGGGAPSS
ncbi:hypothetical protein DSUL_10004 [Desulfovibrionales bacterium]